jgi:hypothetical protein
MTASPRIGLAGFALAALAVLFVPGLAVSRASADSGHAQSPATSGHGALPAAAPGTGRMLVSPALRKAVFDSTRGDSFAAPQIYMAWKAPYGTPGARANLDLTCSDSSEVDTLYLSFETGRDLPGFVGLSATLRIHPADGDSLGPFWFFGSGGANPGVLKIQLDPDGTFPCSQPWVRSGVGVPIFKFHPWAGDLSFVYAVPLRSAVPISGRTRYCFARVLLEQRRCRLPGVRQPVCIEWVKAAYSGGGRDFPIRRGPARYVTLNSPDGSVCGPYRSVTGPGGWRPARRGPGAAVPVRAVPVRAVPPDSARR